MSEIHHTDKAPAAIGPYSQAVSSGGWVFTAGQVGLDSETGELVPGGIEAETEQALRNLGRVLEAAGCGVDNVVKTTIYLSDMAHFAVVNRLYGGFLGDHRPARSTVQVAGLPKGALVEIDLVAHRG
jgi:2-iminobutanoate/2-iminopropanoate deaminase